MIQCSFHKLVLKYSLISQSGLLACSNYLQLFEVNFLVSYPSCIMNSPPYCPLPFLRHCEDGYKDSRLRICFRVKSNGEFKCRCLPSCSMIYLKHPSFGIQLKHLTTKKKGKEVADIWAWEIRNACRMCEEALFLCFHCPDSWLFLKVVFPLGLWKPRVVEDAW